MKLKKEAAAPVLTPYAVLLVKPTDTDDTIRRAYHALARAQHPDLRKDKEPGPRWQEVNEAYPLIETVVQRTAWAKAQAMKSGLCAKCGGVGTVGARLGKSGSLRLCAACKGFGRG